jgi:hypothetical protein
MYILDDTAKLVSITRVASQFPRSNNIDDAPLARISHHGGEARGSTGCGKTPRVRHSERSEEPLQFQNQATTEILRRPAHAGLLRVAVCQVFPRPVNPCVKTQPSPPWGRGCPATASSSAGAGRVRGSQPGSITSRFSHGLQSPALLASRANRPASMRNPR